MCVDSSSSKCPADDLAKEELCHQIRDDGHCHRISRNPDICGVETEGFSKETQLPGRALKIWEADIEGW
jgi:hypothetical protein